MAATVKLLCFDLDDTLWPCTPTILAAEQSLYQWMQQVVPEITAIHDSNSLREKRIAFWKAHPELGHDLSEMRMASMRSLADEFGLDHDWVEPGFDLYYQARQQISLFPDVAPVMEQLNNYYRMAAVTNGNADIHLTGVAHWFEFVITAAAVGHAKPHANFFDAVQAQSRLDPAEIVVIGDDPERDIIGAGQQGMRTVWVNRTQLEWEHPEHAPDAEVIDFSNLAEVLKRLEPTA